MARAHVTRRRRRVAAWICAGLLLVALVSGYFAYRQYTDPARLCRLAEDFLARLTQRKVSIASASFSLREGISLRDVYVSNLPISDDTPASSPLVPEEEIFSCHEISILQDSWALLRGRLVIESFAAIHPTLTLVHDANTGWAALGGLLRGIISRQKDRSGSAPPIELRHARVRIIHRSPAGDRDIEDFQLTVRGRRDADDPRLFNVVWQDVNDPDANGHTQVDLATGDIRNVRGGLPAMSVRGVMLAVGIGHDGADAMPDLLGIEGRVRVRDYNFMTTPLHDNSRSATVELKHAAISIPISAEERALKPGQRYLRFDGVNGTAAITTSTIDADFTGSLHGSPCAIRATINGPLRSGITLSDVAIVADVSVKQLDLPDRRRSLQEDRFVAHWPAMVKFYEDFDPHGKVDAVFHIEKALGENASLAARRALITAQGVDASCDIFPYRVGELHGEVEFSAAGLFVRELCGRREDARICLNGWLEQPKRTSPARFAVTGEDVPIDEDLLSAMRPNARRWVEEFGLAGRFHTTVSLIRDASNSNTDLAPWHTTVHATFDDLSAVYQPVPVPVTHLAGQLTIHRDRLEVDAAVGAIGDGFVQVHGLAEFGEGLKNLILQLNADDIALDKALFANLPPNITSRIQELGLTGCASAQSELTFTRQAGWDHDTLVSLRGMGLRPQVFPVTITNGLADLQVDPQHIEIIRARGSYKGAGLFAKGRFSLGAHRHTDVLIEAGNLPVDAEFRKAAPPSLRNAIADWAVEETIQAQIRFRQGQDGPAWSGRATLADATVHHAALTEPLHDVNATVSFADAQIQSAGAKARFHGADLQADFQAVREAQSSRATIQLSVSNLALDDTTRALLPDKAQKVWEDLAPKGQASLVLDDLSYLRESPSGNATWSARGQLYPMNVRCAPGDLIIERAVIPFSGTLLDRLGGITLSGNIRDAVVTLYGQRVTDASSNWYVARAASGEGRAALRDFGGSVSGGTVTAQGQLAFLPSKAQYRVASSMQGVQLATWLEAWRANPPLNDHQSAARDAKGSDVRGLMDAQFHLSGVVNNPMSRTGGGRVEIHDGYIYKLPIFLAILNVLDITIPNNDVLSDARAQFYIMGNSVRLADIVVSGESLSLVGDGTLSLSDKSVDLKLVNAGAGRLSGIPVLAELWEGASRELVELRVTGPVSQPQVRASPFRGVTDEFKKLFQKRKPKRI